MKTSLSFCLVALLAGSAGAQAVVDLPRPSNSAKVSHTVGLTDISIEYSSPAVRGRPVWGSVVKNGEVWRAGANATTKITFSKDITFGTTAVPAGSYGLFAIPNAASWTIILNKDFAGSPFGYKKDNDVARVEVKPEAIPNRERLVYLISDATNEGATIDLEWEKVRVRIPVKVATDAQVAASLKAYDEMGSWMPTAQVARYYFEQKKDYNAALAWADRSIKIKEDWFNVWTKAQILNALNRNKEAQPLAVKAQQLGEKVQARFFFADDVKKAVADWKAAAPAPKK